MTEVHPFPAGVDLIRGEQVLEIAWDDGHRSRYPSGQLRWACPCAECRGEMGVKGRLDSVDELPSEEMQITDVGLVGSYALQFVFLSNHSTGIYTFGYLRSICPCAGCRAARTM